MQPQQQPKETNNRHLTTGRNDQQQKRKTEKGRELHTQGTGGEAKIKKAKDLANAQEVRRRETKGDAKMEIGNTEDKR